MSIVLDLEPEELPVVLRALDAYLAAGIPLGDSDYDDAQYARERIREAARTARG